MSRVIDPLLMENNEIKTRGIKESETAKCFEFYCAGVLHASEGGTNRQDFYKQIYERAQALNPEVDPNSLTFPIGKDEHEVLLQAEDNMHDPYAVKCYLVVKGQKFDVGYVPRVISRDVSRALRNNRITEGKIYKVRYGQWRKDCFTLKIVVGYDGKRFISSRALSYERLKGAVDEL